MLSVVVIIFLQSASTDSPCNVLGVPGVSHAQSVCLQVAALANACGVGGGAFFVPMFNILLGFSKLLPMQQPAAIMLRLIYTGIMLHIPFGVHSLSSAGLKGSTALSQAVVTGGALAGFVYSSSKRHPDDHEHSLIDFDLALILTPMLLLGITAGKAWSNVFVLKMYCAGINLLEPAMHSCMRPTCWVKYCSNALCIAASAYMDRHHALAHSAAWYTQCFIAGQACMSLPAGVLINAVMPNWLITLLLVLVLTWLTVKTFSKGWQLHNSEVMAQQGQQTDQLSEHLRYDAEPDTSTVSENGDSAKILRGEDVATDTYNTVSSMDDENAVLASSTRVDMESGQVIPASSEGEVTYQQPAHQGLCFSWRVVQFAELSCLWAAFLGLQCGKISFSQCSWQYALICAAQAVFSLTTTGVFIFQAHALRSVTPTNNLQVSLLTVQKPVISHHSWSMSKLMHCVFVVLIGGIVAGMLGFGGGMVLNPLMLDLGMNPLVSSATSSVMVLFSASAATFSFAVSSRLNYQYAIIYGGVCAVASIFGVAVISTSVRRSGKGSRIVFTLAFIIAVGALMQAVFGGLAAVHDIRTGRHLSFSPLC